MNQLLLKFRARLVELRNHFAAAVNRFDAKRRSRQAMTERLANFEKKNLRYVGCSLRDGLLAIVFFVMLATMWLIDFILVGPFVDLSVDSIENSFLNIFFKVLLSFIFLTAQLMFVWFNKKLEEEYEAQPLFPPKHLKLSRWLKFLLVLVLYSAILVYRLMVVSWSGDFLTILMALFGFLALFVLAVAIHLALGFRGRWLMDSVAKVVYAIRHSISTKRSAARASAEYTAEQKACKAFEEFYMHFQDCTSEFPNQKEQFIFQPRENEREFLKRQYRFGMNDQQGPNIPNTH